MIPLEGVAVVVIGAVGVWIVYNNVFRPMVSK